MEDPLAEMAVSDTLISRLREAETLVSSTDGLVRVLSHYDGDGICSAGIVSRALFRAKKRFHTSMMNVINRDTISALAPGFSLLIVCDMGSTLAPDLSDRALDLGVRVIILDHHQPDGRGQPFSVSDGRGVLEINPRFHAVNGSTGCCGSTLAFLFAMALSPENIGTGVFALAGAIADRQNVPEFTELNANIRSYLQKMGTIRTVKGLPLQGRTISESLIMSNDPFLQDLSGNPLKVSNLLGDLGIDPDRSVFELPREKLKLLQSFLYTHILSSGVDPGAVHELFRETAYSEEWGDLQSLAFEIDSCGRVGDMATGLEVIWGSKKAREKAFDTRHSYRSRVQDAVRKMKETGPRSMESIDVIEVSDEKMAGVLAGITHNYVFSHSRPVLALSRNDDEAKISSRGNRGLCKRGLNLGKVMADAAREVGGTGGGHDVAAGATVPLDRVEEFLSTSDRMVGGQIGRK